jgi:hypothetical protein
MCMTTYYIAVFVDDLAITTKNPNEFIDILENKYKFRLKGTGPITFHLCMVFNRDDDNTLCNSPTKYIEKLIKNYEKLFSIKPNQSITSPLEKGDHAELATSELCTTKQISQYQSMISSLQWIVISADRLDIHTVVVTVSGFHVAPRVSHLDRLQHIYGYLSKMRFTSIRVRTEEPDSSNIPGHQYDSTYTLYGKSKELLPQDALEPLGTYVALSHYVDSNLMHDVTMGKSVQSNTARVVF